VRLTLKRLAAAGLGWPLPAALTDGALEAQLFTAAGKKQGLRRSAEPDWATLHREVKREHVTLQILWDECIERRPNGYRYSRLCELYRGWASRISVTMRQTHAGGDKLFVDYAGDTVAVIVDRLTGKIRPAQIFVAVLGASNFTHAQASWNQGLADWMPVEQRRGHFGVAKDARPFAESEDGGEDDRGALVEPADQVKQQLTAGLREWQIAELLGHDEVHTGQIFGKAILAAGASAGCWCALVCCI
jgi:hypothetical protein